MSASISCLTSQRSGSFGVPAMQGPTMFFSTLMGDEAKSIARGLQKRDPDVLDRLIEQYQYRLFRYLIYVTGNKERAEDFFQETWIRVLERGHQYDGKSKFEAWLFAIARHLVIDLAAVEEGATSRHADRSSTRASSATREREG